MTTHKVNETETTEEDNPLYYPALDYSEVTFKIFMVAGGGMSNGNAYANIEWDEENEEVFYCEYGKKPCRKLIGIDIEQSEWGITVVPCLECEKSTLSTE